MDRRIFSLLSLINEQIEANWTVERMAGLLDISVSHFRKLFRENVGSSPNRYLREMRLEKARSLLETTCLQIKQIRLVVGIPNESNFLRNFTKNYGQNPSNHRKSSERFNIIAKSSRIK